jgi:plasmid rolling circle replication initiator protein Rep
LLQLKHLEIKKDFLSGVAKNLNYNALIGEYYERLALEADSFTLQNKLERLIECNQFWQLDKYQLQKVKDFIKTNLCKDKFCNNCKKVKQASRMAKFLPEIEKYKSYGMSQMVLTIPNVNGDQLRDSIKTIFKAFARLIDYLKGKAKIKGLDFKEIGYMGAIRSLEVTYNHDDYHPHLHVLLVHTRYLGEKKIKNKYSIDYTGKREDRLFSEFEILIQKVWYLLINGVRVSKKNIDELVDGYSCMIDKFKDEDFLELFKYMTKTDSLEDGKILSYEQFKVLYYSLLSVRQIQGYGCLFRIKDEDISEEVEEKYQAIIDELRQKEEPVKVSETPQALIQDNEFLLISRKKIYEYLRHTSNT